MTFDPAMNDVSADAMEALGGADETYENVEAGGMTGPWPEDGEYECLFLGVHVRDTTFRFKNIKGDFEKKPGAAIQFIYQQIEAADGEGEFKGDIVTIPSDPTVYALLRPDNGLNCLVGVQAGLRRLKTALGYILGRKPSDSLLADIKEANARIEAGEAIGVMVAVKTTSYKVREGKNKGQDRETTTDYINSAFAVSEAETSEA